MNNSRNIVIPRDTLDDMISEVLQREYGVHDWENDLGGPTAHGITQAVARTYGYKNVKDITPEVAKQIFEHRYYFQPKVNELPDARLQWRFLLDGLHSGPQRIIKRFQKLLNFHNRFEKDYPDISMDGHLGPQTLGTIEKYRQAFLKSMAYKAKTTEQLEELFWLHLCEEMRALQFAWYFDIVDRKPEQEQFFNGWKNRVAFPPDFYQFSN